MLEALGLSAAESAAYQDLVERGMAAPDELPARWDCDATTAGTVLCGLQRNGLVVRHPGPPERVAAMPPDVALEGLALDREEQLRQARTAIAGLTVRYRQGPHGEDPAELVETVTGLDAVMQRWERLQRSARREIRGFDRPPYGATRNELEIELLGNGIAYRSLYHRDSLAGRLDHVEELVAAGEQARVVPDLPLKLVLVDDRFGLVPLRTVSGPDSAVVIHASPLLEALSWLFELVWARAVPVGSAEAGSADGTPVDELPSNEERRLLRLLSAGVTDAAIARSFGWSDRTTYRRMNALLRRLDAGTRFQAGVQATRREWI